MKRWCHDWLKFSTWFVNILIVLLFTVVKEACHNPIFKCILQFSLCVANDLEWFLKLFQSERPLAFFLYEKVKEIMIALMTCFVRADELASANSGYKLLLKLDLKNESNLLPASSVKVGFGTSTELKKLKTIHHTNIWDFRGNAWKLLINLIEKTRECSPLAFKLTHFSALSPTQIVSLSKTTLEKRFFISFGAAHWKQMDNQWMHCMQDYYPIRLFILIYGKLLRGVLFYLMEMQE